MINTYWIMPHLPQLTRSFFRTNHNLHSLLKNPRSAVKKARAAKQTLLTNVGPDGNTNEFKKNSTRKTQVNSKESLQLYLANNKTAAKIAKHLTKSIDLNKTFVETNPGGSGLLTKLLLQSQIADLRLFEGQSEFCDNLRNTYAKVHPKRVKVQNFDLLSLPKSMVVDRLSGRDRTDEILCGLPSTEWEADTNFAMFVATGSNSFFWQLIYSIVFQNSILALGRCEMYMAVPSMTYLVLTSSSSSAVAHYRNLAILFQIFFEYRLLDKFPRADFLPNVCNSPVIGKLKDRHHHNIKGIQFSKIDPDLMYFVKIVPRRDLYKWCPQERIKEFWHFIELNCYARNNRIIPMLEKMIPGCGRRLIINLCTKLRKPVQRIHDVDLIETPPTTNPSMTLSDRDYYDNLNIYTKFGDLQPAQLLTLFREFRMLPEYSSCSFLPSLESVLQKRSVLTMDDGNTASVEQTSTTDGNSVVK